jgi:hypothetical protein
MSVSWLRRIGYCVLGLIAGSALILPSFAQSTATVAPLPGGNAMVDALPRAIKAACRGTVAGPDAGESRREQGL